MLKAPMDTQSSFSSFTLSYNPIQNLKSLVAGTIDFGEPVISQAIEPKTNEDNGKLWEISDCNLSLNYEPLNWNI